MSEVVVVAQINLLNSLNERIDKIAKAERITKAELGAASREILEYIVLNNSPDVATVNRLLAVLTPMNKKTAVLFFTAFLPHKVDGIVFGGKIVGEKKITALVTKTKDFLSDPNNDIWTWAEANIQVEQKPKDYKGKIAKTVKAALSDEEEGITASDVLSAVLEGGVTLGEIMHIMEEMAKVDKKAA